MPADGGAQVPKPTEGMSIVVPPWALRGKDFGKDILIYGKSYIR